MCTSFLGLPPGWRCLEEASELLLARMVLKMAAVRTGLGQGRGYAFCAWFDSGRAVYGGEGSRAADPVLPRAYPPGLPSPPMMVEEFHTLHWSTFVLLG